ncbi:MULTISPECIES: PilZ domain-containing protein [Pseudomonas]|uniref:Cyclic diguanosine monophosphate-binding protein n=1 Tax=Pseudomonas shahriarae TaxID=2745512 RepID=A0ABT5N820_9PSED|nr:MULTISPECIES: PilZ domain-containing protein [Pseudomonas]MBJ2288472.1 PilZ domain-containing protein [Pseudomonas sp. MF5691]MDD0984596.1 PilZ domain-containing protein [Pseudomonas shahriarae]MDD1033013.1 PilZ domain-containing protein [Pseudomonas shahriarae]
MSDQPSDRRRFRRIAFNAKTELKQNGQQWPVQLVDLSLKGLLVQKPAPWLGKGGEPFDVDIHLDADTDVSMQVRLSHDDKGQLGFVCEYIDLDSISHLRRLIELNLGDEEELHRELGELLNI